MTTEELYQMKIDFAETFNGEHGKKVLKELSDYCFENRNTFVENRPDIQNVNNGKRAVILYIRKLLKEKEEKIQTKAKE